MSSKSRYHLLDSLRGFSLVNMILYHIIWDIVYIFGCNLSWFGGRLTYIWQQAICFSFILISGFCFAFSKKKLLNGVRVLACSFFISLVTIFIMPDNTILFGVLSLIGSSMIIMIPLEKILKKLNPYIGMTVFVLLFILTKNIATGYIGILDIKLLELPEFLYKNLFTAYLGFPSKEFISYDYFPIIPWLFLYISGYFIYLISKRRGYLKFLYKPRIKVLECLGKHSLLVYMLHQPAIYILLYVIFNRVIKI